MKYRLLVQGDVLTCNNWMNGAWAPERPDYVKIIGILQNYLSEICHQLHEFPHVSS